MTTARLAALTAVCTYVLIVSGGVVHATGSSLACPDWPLCHGQWMPAMVGGVEYEHSHRILDAVVGLSTIALAVALFRRHGDRLLAILAVAIVAVQASLGGLTVLYRLPTAVSTSHLGLSLLFLALLVYLSTRDLAPRRASRRALAAAALAALALWLQSVLGAIVRHTGSGLSCGLDPVTCFGTLTPDWTAARLHMAHRACGVVVAVIVVTAAWLVGRDTPQLRGAAVAGVALVLAQVALGVVSVTSGLGVLAVSAHLAVGAALFAGAVAFAVRLAPRAPSVRARPRAPARARRLIARLEDL